MITKEQIDKIAAAIREIAGEEMPYFLAFFDPEQKKYGGVVGIYKEHYNDFVKALPKKARKGFRLIRKCDKIVDKKDCGFTARE